MTATGPVIVHISTTGTRRNPLGRPARKDMLIAVGFGGAGVYRDGELVLDGDRPPKKYRDREGWLTVRHAERYAARRPGPAVWEIRIDAPLWSAVWRRVRPGKWIVVEAGMGFA